MRPDDLARAEKTPGLSDKDKLRLALVHRDFDFLSSTDGVVHRYYAYETRPDQRSLSQLLDEMETRQKMIQSWCDTRRKHGAGHGQKSMSPE